MDKWLLEASLAGLEARLLVVISQIESVRSMMGKRGPGRPKAESVEAEAPKKRKKRVLSPEARAKIIAAQKKRWAAVRKAAKA